MQKFLVDLMRGGRGARLLAGPAGALAVILFAAWLIYAVPPKAPVQAGIPPVAGVPCVDGNSLDGDCCSAAGFQEESRFGFVENSPGDVSSRAVECALAGVNHCEDGIDNDGDGLIDAEDPECSTLNETLRHVILGTSESARRSVRTGSRTIIKHTEADGSYPDPSAFWMAGVCDAGTCACPDTLAGGDPNDPNTPGLPRPACQTLGLSCTTDAECAPSQYPGVASHAAICGYSLQLRRESVYEGNVIARANTRFGRGYNHARTLGVIGGQYFCDGCVFNPTGNVKRAPIPNVIQESEPWWVGPGLCIPSGTESCFHDTDCSTAGDLCDGRLQFDFAGLNPNVILTGGTLDPNDPLSEANDFDRCVAAMDAMARYADPTDPGRLMGDNLSGPSIGAIKLGGLKSTSLDFSGANETFVRDIDSVFMGRSARLTINAHSTSTVVLRVLDRFRIGSANVIDLGPDPLDPGDPGISPDRVLWLFDGARGRISTTQSSAAVGTFLAPLRPRDMRLGGNNVLSGAMLGQMVDIGGDSIINHRPFIGQLPTNLSVEKTVIADPTNFHQNNPPNLPPDIVAAGEDLIYTITVRNNGPSWAPGVVLTDLLPADGLGNDLVSFNSVTILQGNGSCEHVSLAGEADRVVCYLGTLNREDDPDTVVIDNEATIEIRVTTNPDTRGLITNTAEVAGNIEEGFPADNTSSASIPVVGIADLVVTKNDNVDPAVAGEASSLTYTITVDNLGPSDAFDALPTGVLLLDAIPTNLSIISAIHEPGDGGAPQACDISGQNVSCSMGRIDVADAPEVITIVVTPNCDAHLTHPTSSPLPNTAVVSNLGGEIDPVSSNNSQQHTTGFVGEVDLSAVKTDNPDFAISGQQIVYTVTITNDGPSEASQVTFRDTLAAGTSLNVLASPLCSVVGGTANVDQEIECIVGQVFCPTDGNNTSAVNFTVDIQSSVPDMTVITNSVDSIDRFETETNAGNDGDTEDTLIRRLQGLAIQKSITAPVDHALNGCVPGEGISYEFVARNFGPSDADNAIVTDDLDSNLTCTWTCTATGAANCDAANGSGDINTTVDIDADATGTVNYVTFAVTCDIDPGMRGTLSNTANIDVAPLSLPDPFPNDNESIVNCALNPRADLSLVKQVTGSNPAVAGETNDVVYLITVTNLGPSDAIDGGGVVLTDVLPAGAQFVSITPSQGTCDAAPVAGSIDCDLGGIDTGDNATVTVVMTADCDTRGDITNTASAVTGGEADPNTPNTVAVDLEIVGEVDLTSSKADSVTLVPGYVIAGQSMTYTITVDNAGPSDANNVVVTDTLPTGVSFVSGANCSDIGGGQVQCTIANIACGTNAQRTITVAVASSVAEGTTLTNTITSLNRNETEQVPANDGTTLDTTARRETNLAIAKTRTAPVGNCVPGNSVTYQMVVTNAGSSNATGATVVDNFDANLTCNWTCSSAGSASCANANGAGSINEAVNIAAGGGNSVTFVATCTIDPGMRGTLTNEATVAVEAGTLPDPNTFNNISINNCTLVPAADLTIGMTVIGSNPATPGVASDMVYRVRVTNNGPSHAQDGNVTLVDVLPTGASLVTIVPDQGSCSGGATRTCELGDINAGSFVDTIITMTPNCNARTTPSNVATVTTGPGGEADAGSPNLTSINAPTLVPSVTRVATADASVEAPAFVVTGDPLVYTFTARNNGPSDALSSVLTLNFDSDVNPGSNPIGCTGSGLTRTCSLGTLTCANDGVEHTFVYNATVTGARVLGNTSEINTTAVLTSAEAGSSSDTASTDIRIPQGTTCAGGAGLDCTTGFCVTDAGAGGGSFCCDTACAGTCSSCAGAQTGGATGVCNTIIDDTDPGNECAADAPGGCGFDGFCGGLNDAGSGIDRRGQCGYIAINTQCTDTSPPLSTDQSLNCKDALCTGSGVCNQNAANETDGITCNDDTVNTNPDTCQGGTCVGQVHVIGVDPTDFIFVSKAVGVDNGTCGTRTAPCNTIQQGITRASNIGATDVCVDGGTYPEDITLVTGINVRGGFARTSEWLAGAATSIINGTNSAGTVFANNVQNVMLRDFTINGANATGANTSAYAVRLVGSTGITLQNNVISAGNATTTGDAGSAGGAGTTGGGGGNGAQGQCDSTGTKAGGTAGSSGCSLAGGAGGTGGSGSGAGGMGGNGNGAGGGTGGSGGGGGNPGGNGNPGGAGTIFGSNGATGDAGSGGGLSGTLWSSNGGGNGTNATNGSAGGGGGGGGGQSCSICISGSGGGGGGGGGGGCGGTLGTGGGGGGGSFGVFLVNSTVAFSGNTITARNGANGGAGGGGGAAGGGGGAGSAGGRNCSGEVGTGREGGVGRAGGTGGTGGGGAGGPSIAVRCFTSTTSGTSSCSTGSVGAGGSPNGVNGQAGAWVGCSGSLTGC